jgi:uncharacterized protein YifN (PemK superfamily)
MSHDLESEPFKDLNFRVPVSFHKQIKVWAALEEIEMRELLFRMTEIYGQRNSKLPKIH